MTTRYCDLCLPLTPAVGEFIVRLKINRRGARKALCSNHRELGEAYEVTLAKPIAHEYAVRATIN